MEHCSNRTPTLETEKTRSNNKANSCNYNKNINCFVKFKRELLVAHRDWNEKFQVIEFLQELTTTRTHLYLSFL